MKQVRPSELPIYQDDKVKSTSKMSTCSSQPLPLEEPIGKFRQEATKCVDQYKGYGDQVTSVAKAGIHEVKAMANTIGLEWNDDNDLWNAGICYLKEEGNVLPRAGAIALGGLTGYVIGLRRGRVRRYFNTAVGALGVAALLYPQEAMDAAGEALVLTKKAAVVSYNFVVGAKPEKCDTAAVAEQKKKPEGDESFTATKLVSQLSKFMPGSTKPATGDFGQANPADKDMYTTRGG